MTTQKHIVFDFDCTLTAKHWWKGLYMRQFSRNSILAPTLSQEERKFLQDIDSYEFVAHQSPMFSKLGALLQHTWGSSARLQQVRALLQELKSSNAMISISTNGQVNEVMGVLNASGISTGIFSYIHGYDDGRESKIAYDVSNGTYVSFSTHSKEEFIRKVCDPTNIDNCIYVDDDSSEYANVAALCRTVPLEKESTGLTADHIDLILNMCK